MNSKERKSLYVRKFLSRILGRSLKVRFKLEIGLERKSEWYIYESKVKSICKKNKTKKENFWICLPCFYVFCFSMC